MRRFSHLNQILLNLFDVSNASHDNIWVVYTVWYIFASMLAKKRFKNKLNKIWLKGLNTRISKDRRLKSTKVSKIY